MGNGKKIVTAAIYLIVVAAFVAIACGTNIATTTVAQLIPLERNHTIIIDAGHGGVDGGATSCNGILESHLNLEISLKLEDLFHLLGYQTKMIRQTDISVYTSGESIAAKKVSDLRNRVKIVNGTDNAVLISIHQNTFPDSKYNGAQVFYSAKGKELASNIQNALVAFVQKENYRKPKPADGIYLMKHIDCIGVLIECGFLSNPKEESLLRNASYQKKICSVITVSAAQFLTK